MALTPQLRPESRSDAGPGHAGHHGRRVHRGDEKQPGKVNKTRTRSSVFSTAAYHMGRGDPGLFPWDPGALHGVGATLPQPVSTPLNL